ncbi:MAG: O-antigen ligase family protein, partial [Anaerolineae bacterium]|nr:O-antigen ligase family protein [Anaerolineae bacterium]
AGFLTVYLFQWMTGKRREFHLTPVSWTIFALMGVMIFTFILGTGHARPNMNLLKTLVELLLSIGMALVLADVANESHTLRRVTLILLLMGTVSAVVGIILWQLPDNLAEQSLIRLARVGYPNGGVLHYREDGVQVLNERAIGTWIAPNTYGSFLMMVGALAGVQGVARFPVMKRRWLAILSFALIGLALFLSDSRGAFVGLVVGLGAAAVLRYRQLLWVGLVAGLIALPLPQTQPYIDKLMAGFTASDLETQMRLGEYKDALNLIERYPVFGVGFSGVPEIDLYTAVSSTYLSVAVYMGLVGLAVYLLTLGSIVGWGLRWWPVLKQDDQLADVWLGLLGGIIGALVSSIVDHFYFNPQFQATSLMLWSLIGLFLAATRIAWERTINLTAASR